MTVIDFSTANRILFGPGVYKDVGKIAGSFGERCLVIRGARNPDPSELIRLLEVEGIAVSTCSVIGEPGLDQVVDLVSAARDWPAELIIGFGGGSVMDSAKAIAALTTNTNPPQEYLEVVGKGYPLTENSLPVIAIPTTAGTGSEVTRNAVLGIKTAGVKVSLRSPKMLPAAALVDPLLTISLPPALTASTGMDALTQLIEPYVSVRANPLTDMFCEAGITRIARSLRTAFQDGGRVEARVDMSFAGMLGGMALANAGLGAVHGCAAVIGGMFSAPHGAVCARLLPLICDENYTTLRIQQPDSPGLDRYRQVAVWLTGHAGAKWEDGSAWLSELVDEVRIPGLAAYGINQADVPLLAQQSLKASSMKANPVGLTVNQISRVLEQALSGQ